MLKSLFAQNITRSLLTLTFCCLLASCTYQTEEDLFDDLCTPTEITYNGEVSTIINLECARSGCHVGAQPAANFPLDNYNNVKTLVDFDLLIDMVKQDNPNVTPMPPNGKISLCLISKLEAWVAQGAPE